MPPDARRRSADTAPDQTMVLSPMLQQCAHVASLELSELRRGIGAIQRQIRLQTVRQTLELHVVPRKKMERMQRSFGTGSTINFTGENALRNLGIGNDRAAESDDVQLAALQGFGHGRVRA